MTFWRPFAFHLSSIDSILDRQTVTLEDILDEEQVLQETKNLNRKLINFLSQKENLIKMIDYITVEREESADIKQRVRYPNISSEILCLENTHFSDIIYEDEALLDKIYAIITNDSKKTSSSLTLAVYCSKVACNMMQLKFIQTIEYLKKKDLITKLVTKFRYTPSLDVLLKAIYCEHTSPNHDLGVSQMLIEKELLSSLIENFNGQHDAESHEAAAQALIDLILICSRSPSSPIIRHLESKETGSKLISYSLSETNTSELIYGLSVVNELLRLHSIQSDSELQALPTFIDTTISFIPHMMKMFVLNENEEKLKTPIGEQKMFGFRRMKVLETLSALANTGYPDVFQAFFLKNVFKTCLEIFFEFPWNNFIHATIEQMLTPLTTSSPHLLELVRDLGLAERIVDITLQNHVEEQSNKPIFFRRGYMGHLFNISRLIENSSSSSEDLKTFLDGNEKWRLYIDTTYKETINKQKRPFVPSLPQNLGFSEDQTPPDYGGAVDSNYIDFQDDFTDFLYPDEGELNYGDRQFDYQSEQANNFEDEDSEEDSEGDEDTDDDEEGVYSDEEQNTKLGS